MRSGLDAVVVGSGPNGLAAAIELATHGASVVVVEAAATIGGGARTAELTLPGYLHDVCSGAHPLGVLSPFLSRLPLGEHGLEWMAGQASVAHPLDGQPAVMLRLSVTETGAGLGRDHAAYRRMVEPFVDRSAPLLEEILGPAHVPRHPLLLARFGARALLPASTLARLSFRGERARAVLAGCAAHSMLPLERPVTGAFGLLFCIAAHVASWPVARGGSASITRALAGHLGTLGGRIEVSTPIRSLDDLPPARAYLFDTGPDQLARIAGPVLPSGYLRRLGRYRYGPGAFKLDWALDGPIPWRDPACLDASTVHVGGTLEEIAAGEAAVWRGEHPARPFVLVVQQSQIDPTRAPAGRHTGHAYCHVPAGSPADLTEVVERQVERFAPGFRDRILARHAMRATDLEQYNPNYVGGAINGGVADLVQIFARPVARLDPYSTPHQRVFICSAATPPGAGVHGMCGYHAARSALRRLPRLTPAPLR